MSPENVSPLASGYRTPPTPGNKPTILNDQIPYLSLGRTDSPPMGSSISNCYDGSITTLDPNSEAYPFLYSTPPTAFPQAPLAGSTFLAAAQESHDAISIPENYTRCYTNQHIPEMEAFGRSSFVPTANPNTMTIPPFPIHYAPYIFTADDSRHITSDPASDGVNLHAGQEGPASTGAVHRGPSAITPLLFNETPTFKAPDNIAVPSSGSDDTDKWYNQFDRASRELAALQKQFHGILQENRDLKVENNRLRADLKWALGLNHWLPYIQTHVNSATISTGRAGPSFNQTMHNNIVLPLATGPIPDQPYSNFGTLAFRPEVSRPGPVGPAAVGIPMQGTPSHLPAQGTNFSHGTLGMSLNEQIRQTPQGGRSDPIVATSQRRKRTRLEPNQTDV